MQNNILILRRRVNLEVERADAMHPDNVETNLARVRALMQKNEINVTSQMINLDESGFSMRRMTFGLSKCIIRNGTRCN